MQSSVRTRFIPYHVAAVAMLVFIGASDVTLAGDAPTSPAKDEFVRVFRFHAAAQAQVLADAVERASFDEALREELRRLVRDYLHRVDEEAERAAKAHSGVPAGENTPDPPRPLAQWVDEADELARQFNDEKIAAWLDAHPSAYQPVQEQIALAEAYGRAATEEPHAIVSAARAAGLPQEREAELRKTVTAAHDRLRHANEAAMKRLREAEDKVNAAEASAKTAKSGTAGGPATTRQPLPAPSAAEQALQLLEHLTWADEHTRGVAAANEVRTAVEKLLPDAPQRKVAADEMLRWYQNHAPPEDGPREPVPPTHPPRTEPSRKPSPAGDPGF